MITAIKIGGDVFLVQKNEKEETISLANMRFIREISPVGNHGCVLIPDNPDSRMINLFTPLESVISTIDALDKPADLPIKKQELNTKFEWVIKEDYPIKKWVLEYGAGFMSIYMENGGYNLYDGTLEVQIGHTDLDDAKSAARNWLELKYIKFSRFMGVTHF